MEPLKCELQSHSGLLAQYTTVQRNVLRQRVPHTRTVYATTTVDNDTTVVFIQGLQFTLYVTSDSELSDSELAHWIQDSYCYEYCSRRALNALQSERDTLLQSMVATGHFQENDWARCSSDEERRLLFQSTATAPEDAPLFSVLLAQWRQLVEMDTLRGLRQASGQQYTEYRRLEDPDKDRNRLDADAFFVLRGIRRMPVHHSWPCAIKLKDQAVWALQFEDSRALEQMMNKFHWPMEIGGVWFPERVEGRHVQMTLLEPVAWGVADEKLQLKFYEQKRGTGPHDYVLAQTPHLTSSARTQWSFDKSETALGGVLQPAAYQRPGTVSTASHCVELPGENRFAQVCALARHNAQRVRSNRLTLVEPLAQETLLVQYGERRETKLRKEQCAPVDYTKVLAKQVVTKKKIVDRPATTTINLKRQADAPLNAVAANATKKQRNESGGGGAAMKQSNMWSYFSPK